MKGKIRMDKDLQDAIEGADLSGVAADISGDEAQEPAKPKDDKGTDDVDLGQFKTVGALKEGYANVQGFATRVSQENKELKERLGTMEERMRELEEKGQTVPQVRTPEVPPVEYDELVNNPTQTISQVVAAHSVAEALQDMEEECAEKGENYQELFNYAQTMAQNPQYAHLANSGRGVKQLFKLGDKLRKQQLKTNARRSLEMVFGEPFDDEAIDKLKGMLTKKKSKEQKPTTDAYMPDSTSSAFRPGPAGGVPTDHDRAVAEAAEKGDLDGALNGIFAKVLEDTE